MHQENLSFFNLFQAKDFFESGYLKFSEIREILEKELGLFINNLNIFQAALSDKEDKISLNLFEKLLNNTGQINFDGKKILSEFDSIKMIKEKQKDLLQTLKNVDYNGENKVSFKQFIEVIMQHKINVNENALYKFISENHLIVDVYEDLLNYNEVFSFFNVFLQSTSKNHLHPQKNLLKSINMQVLESIKKIIQNKLKTSKITVQKFFKNINKSLPEEMLLVDFQNFLAENLGLYNILDYTQIEAIFSYFDVDNDGKLSYSDFLSAVSSKDLEKDRLKELLNKFMLENKINLPTLFRKIDVDCDNYINFQELENFLQKTNPNEFNEKSLSSLFQSIDSKNDRKIDQNELETFLEENNQEFSLEQIIFKLSSILKNPDISEEIFSKYDTDGNESLSYSEFMTFFQKKGFMLENNEFQLLFKYFDKDSSGKIEKNEFLNQINSLVLNFSHHNLKTFNHPSLSKSINFQYIQKIIEKLIRKNKANLNKNSIQIAFFSADLNQDGLVSFSEFIDALKKAKLEVDISDSKSIFKHYDELYTAFIDYEVFLNDLFFELDSSKFLKNLY